jgi:hypothetical protein
MLLNMKPGIATSLSIAGVLLAGGAALALNSTVLQASSTVRGTPALAAVAPASANAGQITPIGQISPSAVADAMVATTSPQTKKSGTDDSDAVTTDSSVPTPATTIAPSPTGPAMSIPPEPRLPAPRLPAPRPPLTPVDKIFQVEDFASITVTASGRTLSVKSVVFSPDSQYTVTNQTSPDYTSTTQDHVRVVMTSASRTVVFSARLMDGQVVAAISDPSSANLPPRRYHDDDDDDREDEEHERREEREHEDENHEERENDDD